jgi:hypothetical protein
MQRNINPSKYDSTHGQESRQAGCSHASSPTCFWALDLPALRTFIALDFDALDGELV